MSGGVVTAHSMSKYAQEQVSLYDNGCVLHPILLLIHRKDGIDGVIQADLVNLTPSQ